MPDAHRRSMPADLGPAGRELWLAIAGADDAPAPYVLRPDEFAVLEDAARTSDMIDALAEAWNEMGKPMTGKGSMGQPVIHPLVAELRTYRAARAALLKQLRLPEEVAAPAANPGDAARKAAAARWGS